MGAATETTAAVRAMAAAEMGMVEAPAATDTLLRHSAAGWGIPSSPLVGS